jgi:YebC/PmpR family DNA-binding regulatory protein
MEGTTCEEYACEGYGPAGVAFIVNYMTDNKNRSVSEIRSCFTRHGGRLAEAGSVIYLFDKKGFFTFDISVTPEDALMKAAIEAGAEDVRKNIEDGAYEVYCAPQMFHSVKSHFDSAAIKYTLSEITMTSTTTVHVEGAIARKVLSLMETLDDLYDVVAVYSNFDVPAEEMVA